SKVSTSSISLGTSSSSKKISGHRSGSAAVSVCGGSGAEWLAPRPTRKPLSQKEVAPMSLFTSVRGLFSRPAFRALSVEKRSRRPLLLEPLEERVVLSNVYTGSFSGSDIYGNPSCTWRQSLTGNLTINLTTRTSTATIDYTSSVSGLPGCLPGVSFNFTAPATVTATAP